MPQKKNYVNYFTMMALGIEKKITQLLNYVRPLSPTPVGKMQERMLMDLTHQLQASIDPMQLTWLEKQDKNPNHPISTELARLYEILLPPKIRRLGQQTQIAGTSTNRTSHR